MSQFPRYNPSYDPYGQTTANSQPSLYVTSIGGRRDRPADLERGPVLPPLNNPYLQVNPYGRQSPRPGPDQYGRAANRDRYGQESLYSSPAPEPFMSSHGRPAGRDRCPCGPDLGRSPPAAYVSPYGSLSRPEQRRDNGHVGGYPPARLAPPTNYRTYIQLSRENVQPNPSDRSQNYLVRAPSNEPPSDRYDRSMMRRDGFVQEAPGQRPQRDQLRRRLPEPNGVLQWVQENPQDEDWSRAGYISAYGRR